MTTKLCVYVKSSTGTKVLCDVLEHSIYDYRSILPLMIVRAVNSSERLNPINRIIVPMAGLFSAKATS